MSTPSKMTNSINPPPSKRWTHFYSALQLAIQRAAHKWTYEDFTECFLLWCEEEPAGAAGVFNTISGHMESQITQNCDMILDQYIVRPNLDILHVIVTEARARKQSGVTGKDVWRDDLQPRTAVRARTVPVLEKERDRLKATLEELEAENLRWQKEFQANIDRRKQVDAKVVGMLDALDQINTSVDSVDLEEIETWAVQALETLKRPASSM